MRELAAQDEADRRQIEAGLLADLGHEASATERLLVETIAAQTVRARRARAQGRHDRAEMAERLTMRGLTRLGIRQGQQRAPGDMLADIVASYARPAPVAQNSAKAPETPSDSTRISEPSSGHNEDAQ